MSIRKPLLAGVTLAATFFAIPTFAADTKDMTPAASSSATATTGEITEEQAVEMALKAHPGTVVKARDWGRWPGF
jgi:hypothetical protein